MANRFCDTEIWNKDWYLDLNMKQKLLVKYLFDACDCAGFFQISWNKLKFFIGEEVTKADIEAIKQVKFINDSLIFIEDFILFQYKIKSLDELNPKNNAHKGVLKRLNEFSPSLAPSQPLVSPLEGVIGNRKKEEGNRKESNFIIPDENFEPIKKVDPYSDPLIDDCIEKYKERCSNLCSLTGFERRDFKTREKISEFLTVINRDMAYFERLCDMANQLKFIANHKIDLCSMVNNHIGIINGKFANTEAEPRAENNKNSIAKELALINAKMGVKT
jgi:hypothetical protein